MELFYRALIDVFLETSWCVEWTERHNLVLEVAISDVKDRLLLVNLNSHPIIGTCEIQLV